MRDIDLEYYEGLLREISEIVRVPTSATPHRKAKDHFQADFDAIRKIVAIGLRRPDGSHAQCALSDPEVSGLIERLENWDHGCKTMIVSETIETIKRLSQKVENFRTAVTSTECGGSRND